MHSFISPSQICFLPGVPTSISIPFHNHNLEWHFLCLLDTAFLIWFLYSRLCVVFLFPTKSNVYFFTFTESLFIGWVYFLSLACIRVVLYNWLNLMSLPYTNCSDPCLHAFNHAVSVLECTSPISQVYFIPVSSMRISLMLTD